MSLPRLVQILSLFMQRAADILTVLLKKSKKKGLLAGVAINPATPVSAISCVLEKVDMVLVMTVNPGFGGRETDSLYGGEKSVN